MSEKHTPGPWKIADHDSSIVICFQGKETPHKTTPYFAGGGALEAERNANARRIVACVNACIGVPTNILELDQYDVAIKLRHREHLIIRLSELTAEVEDLKLIIASDTGTESAVAELQKQRDELLNYVESEYAELADVRNNWPGRHTLEGQAKLCRLRDLICEITGRDAEDVQDDFSNRLAVIVLKENTK